MWLHLQRGGSRIVLYDPDLIDSDITRGFTVNGISKLVRLNVCSATDTGDGLSAWSSILHILLNGFIHFVGG